MVLNLGHKLRSNGFEGTRIFEVNNQKLVCDLIFVERSHSSPLNTKFKLRLPGGAYIDANFNSFSYTPFPLSIALEGKVGERIRNRGKREVSFSYLDFESRYSILLANYSCDFKFLCFTTKHIPNWIDEHSGILKKVQ